MMLTHNFFLGLFIPEVKSKTKLYFKLRDNFVDYLSLTPEEKQEESLIFYLDFINCLFRFDASGEVQEQPKSIGN